MQQHLMQMQPIMAAYYPNNVTTDHIQQVLSFPLFSFFFFFFFFIFTLLSFFLSTTFLRVCSYPCSGDLLFYVSLPCACGSYCATFSSTTTTPS